MQSAFGKCENMKHLHTHVKVWEELKRVSLLIVKLDSKLKIKLIRAKCCCQEIHEKIKHKITNKFENVHTA